MSAENNENSSIENLKDGYEQIKIIYQIQADRLKTSDEKLNMLLVFNAAIIALLTIVVPFSETGAGFILLMCLFSVFVVCVLLTIIFIFWGLFPRKLNSIDIKGYIDANQYNCTRKQYIGKYISAYEKATECIANSAKKKQTMIKHSMIATAINIVLVVAMVVVKII